MFERINMDTGERKTWTIPANQLKDPSGNTAIAEKVWGKAWLYGNGNLGFGTGGSTADQVGMQIRVFDPSGEKVHASSWSLGCRTFLLPTTPMQRVTPGCRPLRTLR